MQKGGGLPSYLPRGESAEVVLEEAEGGSACLLLLRHSEGCRSVPKKTRKEGHCTPAPRCKESSSSSILRLIQAAPLLSRFSNCFPALRALSATSSSRAKLRDMKKSRRWSFLEG